jgi:uncharacterized membrane protein YhaH (DUF805 family)
MNSNSSKGAIRRMTFIQWVVWGMVAAAMVFSASHVFEFAGQLGVQSVIGKLMAVVLVDIVVLVSKLSMYHDFERSFRRSGLWLLLIAGTCSLIANVGAGDTLGDQILGAATVVAWLGLETHAERGGKRAVKTETTSRKLDPQTAADRAAKAKATKAARKLEREAAAEAERWAKLTPGQRAAETKRRKATAPVSPAPAGR